jgi:hypothetical protein
MATFMDTVAIHQYWRKRESQTLPKVVRIAPPVKQENTIHDLIAAHPELKTEPWVQKVLDAYQAAIDAGFLLS